MGYKSSLEKVQVIHDTAEAFLLLLPPRRRTKVVSFEQGCAFCDDTITDIRTMNNIKKNRNSEVKRGNIHIYIYIYISILELHNYYLLF